MASVGLDAVRDLANRYTAAWCSNNAASVAACYSPGGSLTINGGAPSVGTEAIKATVQGFMTAFPDLRIYMDDLLERDGDFIYKWTLEGTNSGPGGTGNKVRISGYEQWQTGADGLVQRSLGNYDAEDFQRQLAMGNGP